MNSKRTTAERKLFRAMDKKVALSEAEKARRETLKKTAKLRELRLAKEAAERAEGAKKAQGKPAPAKKSGR